MGDAIIFVLIILFILWLLFKPPPDFGRFHPWDEDDGW